MGSSTVEKKIEATVVLWRVLLFALRLGGFFIGTILVIGLVLAFLFKVYPWTVGYVIFMNHIHFPPFRNYSDFESHGLHGQNLYLTSGDNRLGVWKLQPQLHSSDPTTTPVVLYIHGAQGSRAAYHRVQMYRILLEMGSPVVTFDYRGYGDSTGIPTSELDLFKDAMVVYRWTRAQFSDRPIFIWGHSLGTGVSARLVETVEISGGGQGVIDGLILDSPYSSMFDVMRLSPLLHLFHEVPHFTQLLLAALEEADVTLNSSDRIRSTRTPLLILHAEDDWVIPVKLGRKIFEVAQRRSELFPGVVSEYVEYSSRLKYGHRGIYRDPLLPGRVLNFAAKAAEWRRANAAGAAGG
ncbi:putative Monoacylglycerol lipase ABHD12 [Hypsibius exemplaris]|uniref:Monoacylglycerol lipase ABHD12 n=1 Tax=Hypsibius exemplaris TaxID=2072580 RepID=A0A1W0XBZ2_HYPEX|nr:putative Monoacylglycerol lipase ABHD12 [Hypsibius exemplaris]